MSDSEDNALDQVAQAIFNAALTEGRAGELLSCLFDGGTATVDIETGKLVLVSNFLLDELARRETNNDDDHFE